MPFTEYRVAAVSENTNSFGLRQFVFVSEHGDAVAGLGNSFKLHDYPEGEVVGLPTTKPASGLSSLGFECPRELPKAPAELVAVAWGG